MKRKSKVKVGEKLYLKALVSKVSEQDQKDGLLRAVIGSTATVDRYGESVDQNTWDLENYKKNPVLLWSHNLTMGEERPPIGRALDVRVENGKLMFTLQFDLEDSFAADIYRKYVKGFLSAFSVGFMPHSLEWNDDTPVLKDNELFELSAVPVPANPEALASLRAKSFAVRDWTKLLKQTEAYNDEHAEASEKSTKKTSIIKKSKTAIVKDDKAKKPEILKGEKGQDTAPKKPQSEEASRRLVEVLRVATHQLQEALAIHNAAQRIAAQDSKKGQNNQT